MIGPVVETIETKRLLLEPLTVEHAEEMAGVLDDPRLHTYIGGEPLTLSELRTRYARLVAGPAPFHQQGWLNWVVRRRRDAQAVGTMQSTVSPGPNGPEAAIAWVIGMPYQGFGFASESAEALLTWLHTQCVTSVYATIHPDNAASSAVARRIGLRPTEDWSGDELIWRPA